MLELAISSSALLEPSPSELLIRHIDSVGKSVTLVTYSYFQFLSRLFSCELGLNTWTIQCLLSMFVFALCFFVIIKCNVNDLITYCRDSEEKIAKHLHCNYISDMSNRYFRDFLLACKITILLSPLYYWLFQNLQICLLFKRFFYQEVF